MSPGRMNATSPTRTSSTIESSLRTFGRSQSGSGGLRTRTSRRPSAERLAGAALRSTGCRARSRGPRSRRSGSCAGTGMPSQISRGRKRAQDRRRAADVIGIAVREHERAEPGDAERPRRRQRHPAAEIERRSRARRRRRRATGAPSGGLDQRRVPLADVEEDDARPTGGRRAAPSARVAARGRASIRIAAAPMTRAPRRSRARRRRERSPAQPSPTYHSAITHSAGGGRSSTSHGATSTSAAEPSSARVPACAIQPNAAATALDRPAARDRREAGDLDDRHQRNRERSSAAAPRR